MYITEKEMQEEAVTQLRKCTSCEEIKPLDLFIKNKECYLGRARTCSKCSYKKSKKWYSDNKERRREAANKRNQDRRDWCIQYLGGKCMDCDGVFHRSVYDFHHRNKENKVDAISNLLCSPDKLEDELKKCDLLCANCHRIRHFKEGI